MLHQTITAYTHSVVSLSFSSDSRIIASAGAGDAHVRLWDVNTGKVVDKSSHSHVTQICCIGKAHKVVLAGRDVAIWNRNRSLTQLLPGVPPTGSRVFAAKISDNKRWLAAAGIIGEEVGNILIWDAKSKTVEAMLQRHSAFVNAIDISGNNRYLLSGDLAGNIILWNLSKEEPLVRLRQGHGNESSGRQVPAKVAVSKEVVSCVEFGPSGKSIAALTQKLPDVSQIILWKSQMSNDKKWQRNGVIRSPDGWYFCCSCAYVRGSQLIAVGAVSRELDPRSRVFVFNIKSKESVGFINLGEKELSSFQVSPDGKFVAAGHENGSIELWRIPNSLHSGSK